MLAIIIAFICYTVILFSFFVNDGKLQKFGLAVSSKKTLFTLFFINALIAHFFIFAPNLITESRFVFSFANTLLLSSWSVSILYFISSFKVSLINIGLIVIPLNIVFITFYAFYNQNSSGQHLSIHIALHILSSILAFSIVMIAGIQALTITYQAKYLHKHKSNFMLKKLPALFQMDKVLYNLIDISLLMLSLSLATGFLFLDNIFAQHLAHKTILSIIAWVIFATLAIGRRLQGWHSRTVTRSTIAASILLLLGFLGSKLIIELLAKR